MILNSTGSVMNQKSNESEPKIMLAPTVTEGKNNGNDDFLSFLAGNYTCADIVTPASKLHAASSVTKTAAAAAA